MAPRWREVKPHRPLRAKVWRPQKISGYQVVLKVDDLRISAWHDIPTEVVAAMSDWFRGPISFGLPDEYKAGVLEGAKEAEAIFPTRGKVALFQIAVHDAVGSAPIVFKFLSRTLIGMLCSEEWPPSDEVALRILSRSW